MNAPPCPVTDDINRYDAIQDLTQSQEQEVEDALSGLLVRATPDLKWQIVIKDDLESVLDESIKSFPTEEEALAAGTEAAKGLAEYYAHCSRKGY